MYLQERQVFILDVWLYVLRVKQACSALELLIPGWNSGTEKTKFHYMLCLFFFLMLPE